MQQFDREYCHDVKNACLQAIANTSFCERTNPLEITFHAARASLTTEYSISSLAASRRAAGRG